MLTFDPDSYPTPLAAAEAAMAPAPAVEEDRGLSRPLDKDAKWRLVRLAKEAWTAVSPEADFDTWRQAEARKATGGLSISEASARHYRLIQAYFLRLKGAVEAARHAEQRAALGALEIARNALRKALAKTKQDWQAARTIAARFYKGAALRDLTAKQVWTVVYTINNNGSAKAGRGKPSNRFKAKRQKGSAPAPKPQPSVSPAPWLL